MKSASGKPGAVGTIIDYVDAATDRFAERPFCEVDSLVLSQFSYLRFNGFVPTTSRPEESISIRELVAMDHLSWLFLDVRDQKSNLKLLLALCESPRFSDVRLCRYVDQIDRAQEKQFSALTFLIDKETAYIAFRGTDSTFVGWKEDFNMAFLDPVPAQVEGVRYLDDLVDDGRDLLVGGHSKGGNVAVYAAMFCSPSVERRIVRVYSHDGPGFCDAIFHHERYAQILHKIHKTLPHSSLIGMLLQQQEAFKVVKSNRFWIMQHDPFSWLVEGDDFCYVHAIASNAVYFNKVLNNWVSSLEPAQRARFIDSLYEVIESTQATTFRDLLDNKREKAIAAAFAIRDIDEETRRFILKTLSSLFVVLVEELDWRKGPTVRR